MAWWLAGRCARRSASSSPTRRPNGTPSCAAGGSVPTEHAAAIDAGLLQLLRRTAALETASHHWRLPEAQRRRQVSEQAATLPPRLSHRGLTRTDVYAVAAGREIP